MNERKFLMYWDIIFVFILTPILILLIPTEKIYKYDSAFFYALISYILVLYFSLKKIDLVNLFRNKKFLKILLTIIIIIISTQLISLIPIASLTDDKFIQILTISRKRLLLLSLAITLTYSISQGFFKQFFRQTLKSKELEIAKQKAELAMYKSQINPHFLFNTLNSLYGLIISKSPNTEEAFIKFSELMKYTYSHIDDFIQASIEIENIEKYIYLQKIRLNHHTRVDFEYEIDNKEALIPSMTIITFIENMFKYGVSSSEDSELYIRIIIKDNRLTLLTKNPLRKSMDSSDSNLGGIENRESTNIGIENTRKRLDLLFPDSYILEIDNSDDIYKLKFSCPCTA